jgi:hypothetical protein
MIIVWLGLLTFVLKRCPYFSVLCRKFSRLLELPSENWQEYLDNWCCHGNEAITKLKDGLNPREYDCFFGDWYILLHPQAINTQNVLHVKVLMHHDLSVYTIKPMRSLKHITNRILVDLLQKNGKNWTQLIKTKLTISYWSSVTTKDI